MGDNYSKVHRLKLPPTKAGRGSNILAVVCDDGLGGGVTFLAPSAASYCISL